MGKLGLFLKVRAKKSWSWGTNPGWSNPEASFHPSITHDNTAPHFTANPVLIHRPWAPGWDHLPSGVTSSLDPPRDSPTGAVRWA